ncbi:hypothetical protein GCM10022229_12470 [Luteimonas lutimaris]|uniref:Uncharacterized protein n=1 Tax=Luteimonas lutimaris TaxID=698645 RepID=A0ABP7MCM1_9GAMM
MLRARGQAGGQQQGGGKQACGHGRFPGRGAWRHTIPEIAALPRRFACPGLRARRAVVKVGP